MRSFVLNLLKYNMMKLVVEETRCDEDREIKFGSPQLSRGARLSVAFKSIVASKDLTWSL